MTWYTRSVYAFAAIFVVIGVALLAATAAQGGGVLGFLLGGLFIALGVGRFTLERRRVAPGPRDGEGGAG